MTGSTKILTVSYGTFSCTLEGFDDPMGAMREMAEYFRDLAADDRYFGAEPPTPDVEMLQNIARRTAAAQVEAQPTEDGIAMRQISRSASAAATIEEAQPSDAPANAGKGPLAYEDDFLMMDEPEDVLKVDPNANPIENKAPAESVVEKLRRIRAVVSRNIEPEENDGSFSDAQAEITDAPKRDRAFSETIRRIEDDLSDDDSPIDETAETEETPPNSLATETKKTASTGDQTDEDTVASILGKVSADSSEPTGDTPKSSPDRVQTKPLGDTNEDVGRLLKKTDSKLQEDDVVHRRRVISQMRAAVVATKADRAVSAPLTPEAEAEAEQSEYRRDLSDAVARTQPLPENDRKTNTPPLVLVSSQRVSETEVVEKATPTVNHGDLARFFKTVGATELPDMLEAAAAYTVFSEGQNSFSRPEIMQRVASVDPALQVSREDSLRSFGQLLRQGKFQKLERGRFTIDASTRFNPDTAVGE